MTRIALVLLALLGVATATVYIKETFDDNWASRWVVSSWKKAESQAGEFKLSAGPHYGDEKEDRGLQTSQDAKFYAASTKLSKPFNTNGKDQVIQFQVRFPQKIDCGGGYIKVFPPALDQSSMSGDSKYNIMFGPDICGTSTKKVHVIFSHNDKNHLIKKSIACKDDQLSHVYTLIVHPDDTYEVRIDGEKKESGKLADDWDIMKPRKIKDPDAKKPSDWDDRMKIDDPSDKKPDDWDSVPKEIPDSTAEKPSDWEDMDGPWEPPMVANPEYKGEWKPKQIDNPDYKGSWVHPEIDNPDFVEYKDMSKYEHGVVGIDVWQVKSGTIFDNIFIGDNIAEAEDFVKSTFEKNKDKEKDMFDRMEKEKREKEEEERKKAEEERKKKEEAEKEKKAEEDDDDDDDEEDDKGKAKDDKLKNKIKEEL